MSECPLCNKEIAPLTRPYLPKKCNETHCPTSPSRIKKLFYVLLIDEIESLKNEQEIKAVQFELSDCYELAYIARWSILEIACKKIAVYGKRKKLKENFLAWEKYINNEVQKPGKISEGLFSIDSEPKSIPAIELLESVLGSSPNLRIVLNSNSSLGSTRCRDMRNNIAHKADKFGRPETYYSYRTDINNAITEIILNLS